MPMPTVSPWKAKLGKLAGIEDDVNVSDGDAQFTNPAESAEGFVSRTGVDSLAMPSAPAMAPISSRSPIQPRLRFDILEKRYKSVCPFPHLLASRRFFGASGVCGPGQPVWRLHARCHRHP